MNCFHLTYLCSLKTASLRLKKAVKNPKHHTQKEIATEKGYSDFEYYLAPTFVFKQEILKEGHELEVIEPRWLRKEIITSLRKTLSRYYSK